MANWIKTTLLLALLTCLMVLIGDMIGGRNGMILAFVMAMGMNFFSYWFSDKIVLSIYNAKEIGPGDNPELYSIVKELSEAAGLPMPRVYIIPSEGPNAFATGRNPEHAAVAVTKGILSIMNREELKGVLAHEMSHIKNRDILISSVAATIAGAIMILANMARWSAFLGIGSRDEEDGGIIGLILISILAPLAAMIVQMAISRSREYLADETGARLAGSPQGLANALEKLGIYSQRIPMKVEPATAHMFIVSPLSGGSLANLFSTHPPLEERIARLRGMNSGQTSKSQYDMDRGKEEARAIWENLS